MFSTYRPEPTRPSRSSRLPVPGDTTRLLEPHPGQSRYDDRRHSRWTALLPPSLRAVRLSYRNDSSTPLDQRLVVRCGTPSPSNGTRSHAAWSADHHLKGEQWGADGLAPPTSEDRSPLLHSVGTERLRDGREQGRCHLVAQDQGVRTGPTRDVPLQAPGPSEPLLAPPKPGRDRMGLAATSKPRPV